MVPGSHPPKVGRDRWFSSPQALLMGGQSKGWLGTSFNKFNLRKIQKNTLLSEEKTNLRKIQKKPTLLSEEKTNLRKIQKNTLLSEEKTFLVLK